MTLRAPDAPRTARRTPPRRASSIYSPARLGRRTYFPLGVLLLSAVLAIYLLAWPVPGLQGLRALPNYALITGALMGSYILAQAAMPLLRMGGTVPQRWVIRAHKLLGALGPLFLIVHADNVGYGYLSALSGVFLGSMALGLFNHETLGIKGRLPAFLWMIAHVALSVALLALVAVHVFYALSYE